MIARLKTKMGILRDKFYPDFLDVMPQSAWKFLPGQSTHFGPPRRWSTFADYSRRHGDTWQEIEPAGQLIHSPLFHRPKPKLPDRVLPEISWTSLGLATIAEARILREDGWVIGRNDTFLGEFCRSGNSRHSKVYYLIQANRLQRLKGVTLNLTSRYASFNFYHWMIDAVSRADLFLRSGRSWDDVDFVVLPSLRTETTEAVVAALGVPVEKILRVDRHTHLQCDTLLQLSLPSDRYMGAAPCVGRFHRDLLGMAEPLPSNQAARLYIPRRQNRRLVEVKILEERLRREGFEEAALDDFQRLRRQLASARHIAAIHGAALTNLIYARADARILEFAPQDHSCGLFRSLVAPFGLGYGLCVGPSLKPRCPRRNPYNQSDFSITEAEILTAVEALLSK